ncbi:MAG TPA: aminodeoxychorismate/anthranilate synthase component II [Ktedonobacteraceae bacterium]|nr:aminodeoxychorismate/anthranilate synthase component II [Ktedonobacteraceae bacterium]
MLLLIDNYDSFTYNLHQYLSELGAEITVRRNDKVTLAEIAAMQPDHIVISPGPCTPDEAGLSCKIIETFGQHIPLLGVCLGHQAIGQVYGGRVVRAPELMHGKTSLIYHHNEGVFHDLPQPFMGNRYHSLIVERSSLPQALEVTAETEDDLVMGLRHRRYPVEGVQFHPESIMTPVGKTLLQNFLTRQGQIRIRAEAVGAFLAADLSEASCESGVGRLDRRIGLAPTLGPDLGINLGTSQRRATR